RVRTREAGAFRVRSEARLRRLARARDRRPAAGPYAALRGARPGAAQMARADPPAARCAARGPARSRGASARRSAAALELVVARAREPRGAQAACARLTRATLA